MNDNNSGKGLSFVRRIYLPRIIGLGIGMFSVMAALAPLKPATWLWALLLFNGLAWPHLAYLWFFTESRERQKQERRFDG